MKEEQNGEKKRSEGKIFRGMTDWIVVKGRNGQGKSHGRSKEMVRKSCRTIQIFVKIDGSKAVPMEMVLTDKVGDIVKRIVNSESHQKNAVHVMCEGKVLNSEELKNCGLRDGCTARIVSRMRGGGKHKDKKSQKERKQVARPNRLQPESEEEPKDNKGPATQDTVVRMIEESEENRKMMVQLVEKNEESRKVIESMSEGSDAEMEQKLQEYQTACCEVLGWDQGQEEMMGCGFRWAVEARRKGRGTEREQTTGQDQGKKVRFRNEELSEEMRAPYTDEQDAMSGLEEVRTGRGRQSVLDS